MVYKRNCALFIILTIIIAILGKISLDDTVESLHRIGIFNRRRINYWCITRYFSCLESRAYYRPTTVSSVGRNGTYFSFLSVVGMYNFQVAIHFILASGSGHAMLTMPIMAPLADLLDITRQTAVLSFHSRMVLEILFFRQVVRYGWISNCRNFMDKVGQVDSSFNSN